MNNLTKILILKKNDYLENDELIKAISFDYGLIDFVSKGSRKSTSKNRNSLNYFMEIEINFNHYENKKLFTIQKANSLKNFQKEYDLEKIVIMQFINELVYSVLNDNENFKDYYNILIYAYENVYYEPYLVLCFVLAQILKNEGLRPEVNKCVVCDMQKVFGFSNIYGGFVCQRHLTLNDKVYDKEHLRKFRFINLCDIENVKTLQNYEYNYDDFLFIFDFFKYHFNQEFQGYKLLKKIKK